MSDERLDDAIRDALLADDPGTVPARLRARMAMIPDVAATAQVNSWRRRLAVFAVPAAVLAAVAIVAVVFGGIALRGQQVASAVPSASLSAPQGSAPATVPSASALASIPAWPSFPTEPITIDATKVIGLSDGTFAIQDYIAYRRWVSDTVSYPLLNWSDLADSTRGKTIVMLQNGHDIAAEALTNVGVVWMETWYTMPPIKCTGTPCSPHEYQPVSWALNLTTLDGKTTRLDTGVVSRTSVGGEVASPLPPEIAAQGDRVAYAVPRLHVAGAPNASAIIVRSLAGGDVVRRIDTHGYIAQLGVFGQALMYRENDTADAEGFVVPDEATLYATPSDAQDPQVYDQQVNDASMGDGGTGGEVRLVWTNTYQPYGTINYGNLKHTLVQHLEATPAGAAGAFSPVVLGDGYAWLVQMPDGAGVSNVAVEVWHPDPNWLFGRLVSSLGAPDTISASGNMLLVSGTQVPVLNFAPAGAVPADALFGSPGSTAAPSPLAQPVDKLTAETLAKAFYAAAPGWTVTDVQISSVEDLSGSWRVTLDGTVAQSDGAYHDRKMVLDVDKATGAVTVFPSG